MRIDNETIIIKRKDIDVTEIDGEKAMMNLEKGQYFMLNEVGSRIWDIIGERCFVRDIVSELIKEYDIDEATCEQNILEFLERLNNAELISIN